MWLHFELKSPLSFSVESLFALFRRFVLDEIVASFGGVEEFDFKLDEAFFLPVEWIGGAAKDVVVDLIFLEEYILRSLANSMCNFRTSLKSMDIQFYFKNESEYMKLFQKGRVCVFSLASCKQQ
jgi:hypothetical protein